MAVDWNDPAIWDRCYRIPIFVPGHPNYGQTLGYTREGMARFREPENGNLTEYEVRRGWLVALGMVPADRILILGCGLGFLVEAFRAAGFTNCWGVDPSTVVQGRKNTETAPGVVIINQRMEGGNALRSALQSSTGGRTFAWVVSESVLESFTDAEIAPLLPAPEGLLAAGRPTSAVVHMVVTNPNMDPIFNVKPLTAWKAMRPGNTWMSAETGQVA